ncbi:hypothetical protein AALB_3406 [Agarivorans albus MKT 106]|uniref:Uncharacterized protein n=1 Tax=Agarivorans albus MKT 106 TaxID=1331007 RepID=R9PU04_AGAAL|nr:hypothetical protein AALB_3406 [Agarivorans albus MKT 106]
MPLIYLGINVNSLTPAFNPLNLILSCQIIDYLRQRFQPHYALQQVVNQY